MVVIDEKVDGAADGCGGRVNLLLTIFRTSPVPGVSSLSLVTPSSKFLSLIGQFPILISLRYPLQLGRMTWMQVLQLVVMSTRMSERVYGMWM